MKVGGIRIRETCILHDRGTCAKAPAEMMRVQIDRYFVFSETRKRTGPRNVLLTPELEGRRDLSSSGQLDRDRNKRALRQPLAQLLIIANYFGESTVAVIKLTGIADLFQRHVVN